MKTIPALVVAFLIVTPALPVLIAVTVVVDVVRTAAGGPRVALRMLLFGWLYLLAEVVGLCALWFVWLASGFGRNHMRLIDATYSIQGIWAAFLMGALRLLFRLELRVTHDEVVRPGPVVVLARHASNVDTLIPSVVITRRHGLRLRYVLKSELLADPCLDVAGNRLPNHFVDRNSGSPTRELAGIRSLTADLGDDGVLIYPEGTRFSERRRRRAIDRLRESNPALADRAEDMTRVLPPRPAGAGVLLDAGTDVVVLAHHGLDGFATVRDVWSGALVGRTVTVDFWRTAAGEVPNDRQARIEWLYAQWARLDTWVGHRSSA